MLVSSFDVVAACNIVFPLSDCSQFASVGWLLLSWHCRQITSAPNPNQAVSHIIIIDAPQNLETKYNVDVE